MQKRKKVIWTNSLNPSWELGEMAKHIYIIIYIYIFL